MTLNSNLIQKKTSKTHPLMFDTIEVGRGTIGMTICPGKKGKSLYGAPWDRDLTLDLKSIREFGADYLVTLMRKSELKELGVPLDDWYNPSIDACASFGHYLIPVYDLNGPDFDPHDDGIFWDWQSRLDRCVRLLQNGRKIVVHCRGGLGRTGTFVSEILMRNGYSCTKAIKTVRAARPGCVETQSQLTYLTHRIKVRPSRTPYDLGETEYLVR